MLNEKDYCDYETRNELIKLGYPAHLYDNTEVDKILGAILLYEAQKWLREIHNLHIEITYSPSCWTCKIYDLKKWDYIKGFTFIESYEEALAEGVRAAVKLLKEE